RLDSDAKRRLPRIVFATAAMGAAVVSGLIVVLRLFPVAKTSSSGRLALLIALVTLRAAVYAATLRPLAVIELRESVAAIRNRTRGPCVARLCHGMARRGIEEDG